MAKSQKVKLENAGTEGPRKTRLSAWSAHKKKVFDEYKSLSASEQTIRAKLLYKVEGKQASIQKMYKTVWNLRNPGTLLVGDELKNRIHSDFVQEMIK